MRRVAIADNLFVCTLWQRILEDAGMPCEVRNRFLGSALGEMPAMEALPQLWVKNDLDHARAETLLEELRRTPLWPPWQCAKCAQSIEAQFVQCWRCETVRGDLTTLSR